MTLIITDVQSDLLNAKSDSHIIEKTSKIHHCIGCFGCWVKTPAKCSIKDDYCNTGEFLSKTSDLIIISECVYGSFSPFVKNILDRAISYVHPFFVTRNGEMHHKHRYDNKFKITVYFYGENISDEEKQTAQNIVFANSINFDSETPKVNFIKNISQLSEVTL